ncbi:MAG TPA: hypothetical protein VNF99_05685 [Stellaceae bacterium]|nr:hypothetical protein [Stellaceae bacterium]
MSSPLSSMDAIGSAHGASALVVDPHVAIAIWAIILAVACALVLFIAEMVKARNASAVPGKRNDPKKPPGGR